MSMETGRRCVLGGVVIFAACIFGAGINWGLPSHQIDPILFGAGADSATTFLDSYHLTGVGIDRLAGDWDENSNLPADVAAHPIADRSKPITLIENPHVVTAQELSAKGDAELARLAAAADVADKAFATLRQSRAGDSEVDEARDKSLAAQNSVQQYVDRYNAKNSPDVSAITSRDAVNRARILRRFRLYSYQPDEMITFRALAMMHPANLQLDPKLYQYGGLWIYPVAGILKGATIFDYVVLTGDRTFYLDSPQIFARFYILARAYSAVWGLVGVVAVFLLVRRAAGGLFLPACAAVCFVCMPVVVDLAHEAKPHLAGVALILTAVLAATNYLTSGKWKWIIWTSIACGASAGMVLSGVVALAILPVMTILRRDSFGRAAGVCGVGILISAAVYFATNPYVAIHLAGDRQVLAANFANTRAMYTSGPDVANGVRLVAAGISWPLAVFGALGAIALLFCKRPISGPRVGWLLAGPAVIALVDFVLFASNKPGEYARFALIADVALMLAAFIAVARFVRWNAVRGVAALILVACAATYSVAYERGFLRDALSTGSRVQAADQLTADLARVWSDSGSAPILYVASEPAPYCLPPVNLFRWKMILLPRDGKVPAGSAKGVEIRVSESTNIFDPASTPISWADKPFEITNSSD